jgi:hypothetical protein
MRHACDACMEMHVKEDETLGRQFRHRMLRRPDKVSSGLRG